MSGGTAEAPWGDHATLVQNQDAVWAAQTAQVLIPHSPPIPPGSENLTVKAPHEEKTFLLCPCVGIALWSSLFPCPLPMLLDHLSS